MCDSALNVAFYARVSSDQQAESGTVASQIDVLLQRIADDRQCVDEQMKFVDDGYSGATLVRPSLEHLRDLAYAGAIDRLYVHSPDRLARKYAYQVLLVEELQRYGVELVFLNQELGQTPEQELLLQVQGMVAEYERSKILERSRRGKRHAARRGSINVLSGAPYGYRYVSKHEGGGDAHYQVVFTEAQVIQQIFAWVAHDRLSIQQVCVELEKQEVLTRTGKARWHRATIARMLKNPAYKGQAAFGKTCTGAYVAPLRPQRGQNKIPRDASRTCDAPRKEWINIDVSPLVDEDVFNAVQEQLQENRQRARQSQRGALHLLQGLIVCQRCSYAYYGKKLSGKFGKKKVHVVAYYRCAGTDKHRFGGQRVCDNKPVRTDMIEQAVWEDVCALLANPSRVEAEYQRRLSAKSQTVGHTRKELTQRLQKVKRAMARLIDAYEDGWLDKMEFQQRIKRSKDQQAKIETQLSNWADEESQRCELRLVIGYLQDFTQQVDQGLENADWQTRRDIIRALVKEIQMGPESVQIVYRIEPPQFVKTPNDGGDWKDCRRRERPWSAETAHARLHRQLYRGRKHAANDDKTTTTV